MIDLVGERRVVQPAVNRACRFATAEIRPGQSPRTFLQRGPGLIGGSFRSHAFSQELGDLISQCSRNQIIALEGEVNVFIENVILLGTFQGRVAVNPSYA